MEDVTEPWQSGVDIMSLTDTDLESPRNKSTRIANSSRELHRMVETLARAQDLDWSATCDRALRIELAHAIDNYEVSFTHEEYDVAYTIPPISWIDDHEPVDGALVDSTDVADEDRTIGFSTAEVVFEMAQQAIHEGAYESLTDVVTSGIERQLGQN